MLLSASQHFVQQRLMRTRVRRRSSVLMSCHIKFGYHWLMLLIFVWVATSPRPSRTFLNTDRSPVLMGQRL